MPFQEGSNQSDNKTYPLFQYVIPAVLQLDDVAGCLVRHGWYCIDGAAAMK